MPWVRGRALGDSQSHFLPRRLEGRWQGPSGRPGASCGERSRGWMGRRSGVCVPIPFPGARWVWEAGKDLKKGRAGQGWVWGHLSCVVPPSLPVRRTPPCRKPPVFLGATGIPPAGLALGPAPCVSPAGQGPNGVLGLVQLCGCGAGSDQLPPLVSPGCPHLHWLCCPLGWSLPSHPPPPAVQCCASLETPPAG